MGRWLQRFALAIVLALPAVAVHASPDARADGEIRHLLDFVGASGCTFIRNGDPHDAPSAAGHLAMKYGKAKSRLASTEQFIEHVASKSFFTGQAYRVQCPGSLAINSGDWLRAELARWRQAQGSAAVTARASR